MKLQLQWGGSVGNKYNGWKAHQQHPLVKMWGFLLHLGWSDLGLGILIERMNFSIRLYADDIVLVAEKEIYLQEMMNIMSLWCSKWRLAINTEKTQIIHFRKQCEQQSKLIFQLWSVPLKYTTWCILVLSLMKTWAFQREEKHWQSQQEEC